jgi:hypothetical protein
MLVVTLWVQAGIPVPSLSSISILAAITVQADSTNTIHPLQAQPSQEVLATILLQEEPAVLT